MNKKTSKVFLSYARADSEPAQKIAQHLRQAGLDVWDPERDVLPGDDLPAETQSALASSDAMVVFISPEAVASRSVSYEIQYALGSKKFSGRLIPVTLRPTKGAPWILSRIANLAYESPKKTGAQIVDLLSSVAQEVPYARAMPDRLTKIPESESNSVLTHRQNWRSSSGGK